MSDPVTVVEPAVGELVPMDGHQFAIEPRSLTELMAFAQMIAPSQLVPEAFRGKPADVVVAILRGRELGFSTLQSLYAFYVIRGKAGLYADAIVALCLQHPKCEYFMVTETTTKQATYATMRKGMPEPVKFTYTMEMAQRAQLTGNPTYSKHPDAMLRARAAAALGRACYPDKLLGIYVDNEIDEIAANIREKAGMAPLAPEEGKSVPATVVEAPVAKGSLASRMAKPVAPSEPHDAGSLDPTPAAMRGDPSPSPGGPSASERHLDLLPGEPGDERPVDVGESFGEFSRHARDIDLAKSQRDLDAVGRRIKGAAKLLTDEHYEELIARGQARREEFVKP